MMELSYIRADKTDVEAIFLMNRLQIEAYENPETARDPKVTQWVGRNIQTHIHEYVCVLLDGQKAAYYRIRRDGDGLSLDDLCVLPEYRGRGIGTAILQRCVSRAAVPTGLYVFIRNEQAVALYRKAGFTVTETVRGSLYKMVRQPAGKPPVRPGGA